MSPRPFQRPPDFDPDASERKVQSLTRALHQARQDGRVNEVARLLGQRGQWQRHRGFHNEAIADLTEALSLSHKLQERGLVRTNIIRLATARQYRGEHEAAEEMLFRLLAVLDLTTEASLWGFTQQHLGKVLAEVERWDEAIACFQEAVRVREKLGEDGPLASSQRALHEARRRQEQSADETPGKFKSA